MSDIVFDINLFFEYIYGTDGTRVDFVGDEYYSSLFGKNICAVSDVHDQYVKYDYLPCDGYAVGK